jgi:hypothetical protein
MLTWTRLTQTVKAWTIGAALTRPYQQRLLNCTRIRHAAPILAGALTPRTATTT